MFASDRKKTVSLPSDPSIEVTIHALSYLQLESARRIAQRDSSRSLVEMGGASFVSAWREIQAQQQGEAEPLTRALADPLNTHDVLTVLICGIESWTAKRPATKESIAELEEPDAPFLAREILALSLPKEETEDEQKNAERPSTAA